MFALLLFILFDDLLTNGTHTWQTSCSELASSLRIQNSDMERTPISIDLASVIPLPLPLPQKQQQQQQQQKIDSSVKLSVKGITPMINSELAASIIVPPIICKSEPPHSRKQARNPPILFGSGGSARVSACNPEQSVNAEVVVSAIVEDKTETLTQEQITRLTKNFETEEGRVAFGRALFLLLQHRGDGGGDSSGVQKTLTTSGFQLLGDLMRGALIEAAQQKKNSTHHS